MSTRAVVLPVLAVAVTLVLWSSAFVAIRYLGSDVPPGALSLGRLLVGSAALGIGVLIKRPPLPRGRDWIGVVVVGVLWYGIYNVALNAAEQRIDAGTASMLIQIAPILVAALAALALGERASRWLVPGLAVAFAGVALIAWVTRGPEGGHADLLGVVLALLAAVVYAVSVVVQKPLTARIPPVQLTWLTCTVGAIACLPFTGELARVVTTVEPSRLWWLVYLGLFPTAIGFSTYAYALKRMTATNLGVTTYLVPPITVVIAWLFLRETPPVLAAVGGVVCLLGVWLARRPSRRTPTTPGAEGGTRTLTPEGTGT